MYKVLVLDLDNTLLKNDKTISEANKKAIKEAGDKGVMVSIASGRPPLDVEKYVKELDLYDSYHIGDNGASIVKFGEEVIHPKCFSEDLYTKLISSLRKNNIEYGLFLGTTPDYIHDRSDELADAIQIFFSATKTRKVSGEEIDFAKEVYKISGYYRDTDEFDIVKAMEREGEMETVVADKHFIDLMPYGITKFTGAEVIAQKLGISTDKMAAAGDQENDFDIVSKIGLGVSVKNGIDKLKDSAKLVLDKTNEEDAIAHLIYNYILKS